MCSVLDSVCTLTARRMSSGGRSSMPPNFLFAAEWVMCFTLPIHSAVKIRAAIRSLSCAATMPSMQRRRNSLPTRKIARTFGGACTASLTAGSASSPSSSTRIYTISCGDDDLLTHEIKVTCDGAGPALGRRNHAGAHHGVANRRGHGDLGDDALAESLRADGV